MFCDHSAARICAHLEHQQYGLGHIRGPIRDTFEENIETMVSPRDSLKNSSNFPWITLSLRLCLCRSTLVES